MKLLSNYWLIKLKIQNEIRHHLIKGSFGKSSIRNARWCVGCVYARVYDGDAEKRNENIHTNP